MLFRNRLEAGRKLAKKLANYKNKKDVIVLGIPRGGVEVAFAVAKLLHVELSIVVTKKIGHPFNPELAIGAVSPDNYIIDEDYKDKEGYAKKAIKELNAEIKKRYRKYTQGKLPQLKSKIVIVVDDGLATGHTMLAAIKYARSKKPKKLIAAVPVSSQEAYENIKKLADKIICLDIPINFFAVGNFYQEFGQLTDEDVISCLRDSKEYP